MGTLKKIKNDIAMLVNGAFFGMKGANETMLSQSSGEEGTEVHKIIASDSVFSDMLNQQETQRVVETRDAYYRILREADKYDAKARLKMVQKFDDNGDEEGIRFELLEGDTPKKTKADFMQHPPCFEDGYKIRTIQDNKHITKDNMFCPDFTKINMYNYDTTLTIKRDGFTPRIFIEKFVTKMVVRETDETNRALVDLYVPTEAGQFSKLDAILIANVNRIWKGGERNSDIIDFSEISWYSDHGWNTEDVCEFAYDDIKFVGINVFDGSFVLTFNCNILKDGVDLAEKYRTKELDEKYANEAPKVDSGEIDMYTMQRHLDRLNKKGLIDNLNNERLIITNDNE